MALKRTPLLLVLVFVSALAAFGQSSSSRQASGLVLLSQSGRRPLPTTTVGGTEMIALDELAAAFNLSIREDALAGGAVVGYKGRTILLTPDQGLVSVAGRMVSLPQPVVRDGRRWLVPLDFLSRALAPIYDTPLELRRASRLVILGNLRVPRVTARVEGAGPKAQVTLEVQPRTGHTLVQEPGRLVVRFEADAIDSSLGAAAVPGLVDGLRLAEPSSVAIDLGTRYASHRATSIPAETGPSRIVIDVMASMTDAPPGTVPPGAEQPGAALPTPAEPPIPLLLSAPRLRTIVLDPGHGGEEEGAKGPGGTLEKDVVLGIARRLKGAIEGRLGVRVLMTREGDTLVPLDERAALANNNQADLFLSLHANASPRAEVIGAQIYYLSTDNASSVKALDTGAQLFPTLGGGSREIDIILWEMAQTRHLGESAAFSALVEEELRDRVPMNAHPVQQAPFRVLVGANMPAVLVEMGFLTNPEQERAIQSGEFQNAMVQALLEAIVRYRDRVEQGHSLRPTGGTPGPPADGPRR